jgi:hypothetical protein
VNESDELIISCQNCFLNIEEKRILSSPVVRKFVRASKHLKVLCLEAMVVFKSAPPLLRSVTITKHIMLHLFTLFISPALED